MLWSIEREKDLFLLVQNRFNILKLFEVNFSICEKVFEWQGISEASGILQYSNRNQHLVSSLISSYIDYKNTECWLMMLNNIWSNSAKLYPHLFINIFQSLFLSEIYWDLKSKTGRMNFFHKKILPLFA